MTDWVHPALAFGAVMLMLAAVIALTAGRAWPAVGLAGAAVSALWCADLRGAGR